MQRKTLANHILIKLLLIVSLAFNQGLTSFVSASAMASMQTYASTDTLAICTGTSMRWIDANVYFDSGKIVEVIAPSDTPTNLHEVDCVFAHLGDLPKTTHASISAPLFDSLPHLLVISQPVLFTSTLFSYKKRARAPPSILA